MPATSNSSAKKQIHIRSIKTLRTTISAGSLALALHASADIKQNAIFTDHMVLQRDIGANIFGTGDENEKVTVTIGGKSASAVTKGGKWLVTLPPMKAGGPYTLTVTGKNTITSENVMLGDVWLCTGQSNMDYDVRQFLDAKLGKVAEEYSQVIKQSPKDNVRIALIDKQFPRTPAAEVKFEGSFSNSWQQPSSKMTSLTSAVGYVFGKKLSDHLGVPIGLIDTNKGGTPVETWMSGKSLKAIGAKSGKSGYNGMIAPLHQLSIKGVIWYQGETNARTVESSLAYAQKFKMMITDWRKAWGQGDFPFLYVQLAGYAKTKGTNTPLTWPFLRESQTKALELPNTAMALALDKGVALNIHPHYKIEVSERLVLAARKVAYGEDLVFSGPQYKSHEIRGNEVIVSFDHIGSGLTAKETQWDQELIKGGTLKGFTICGADKKFIPAKVTISGNTVIVTGVNKPLAVRYAWDGFPKSNFANKDGLPAVPFRTDDYNALK